MRLAHWTLAGLLGVGGIASATDVAPTPAVPPAADAPVTDPPGATPAVPADTAVDALIQQLGDPDPKVREDASRKLVDLGKAALPQLESAKDSDDPEIRSRVRGLIRKAQRRLPPAAPPRHGFGSRQSVQVSMVNGQRSVAVDDNGYRIQIRQGPEGIVMDVTGLEDGKEVTETYKAADAETLKKENPEAFALYDKYNNRGGGFSIEIGGRGAAAARGVIVGPNAEAQQRMLDVQIAAMERMLTQLQEQHPNLEPAHVARIQEHIDRLRQRQGDVQQQLMEQMQKQRERALDDKKVPLRDEPEAPPQGEKDVKQEAAPAPGQG